MKGKEFDVIFEPKIHEFATVLSEEALRKGFKIHAVDVDKQRDFIYLVQVMVTQRGMRMLPMRLLYTIMFNPVTEDYIWHEGLPRAPRGQDERLVN